MGMADNNLVGTILNEHKGRLPLALYEPQQNVLRDTEPKERWKL